MLTTIVSAIFVLGLLVFIHELGHFMAAKRMGIKVEQFSLGFPPKMIGKTIGDTEYCISWIPLGGYVKMAGEHPDGDEVKGEPWEFQSKSISARSFVIAAGPGMNFVLAFFIFWVFYFMMGIAMTDTTTIGRIMEDSPYAVSELQVGDEIIEINNTPVDTWEDVRKALLSESISQAEIKVLREGNETVVEVDFVGRTEPIERISGLRYFRASAVSTVISDSPAERTGLKSGDVITSVDGISVTQWYEMVEVIRSKPGIETMITWTRNDQSHQTSITPNVAQDLDPETGEVIDIGQIGITQEDHIKLSPVGFIESVKMAGLQVVNVSGTILMFIKKLVGREISTDTLGGPIAIAKMAGDSAKQGASSLFSFIAFLSINLAILNLLPIPALDGGQLLILGVEGIIRRPLSLRQRLVWQQAGMAILLVLMFFVLYNDVTRILR
jgi:regulator of sigma E protease